MKFLRKILAQSLSLLVLSAFFSAISLNCFAGVALAADKPEQPTLQIYYSESLGTGEKVYHLTACNKIKAVGIMNCTQDYIDNGIFKKQCDDKAELNNVIKGCLVKDPESKDVIKWPGTEYNKVDLDKYENKEKECPEPEDQGPLYGNLKALVPVNDKDGNTIEKYQDSDIEFTIAVPFDAKFDPLMPDADHPRKYLPLYQTDLCSSWDKVMDDTGGAADDTTLTREQIIKLELLKGKIGANQAALGDQVGDQKGAGGEGGTEMTFFTDPAEEAESLATQDNCTGAIHSSLLDPAGIVSCTIMERVTGKSGTEILSKYMQIIYSWASGIVGIIAVLTMVYSGIQISMAGGDSAKIDDAKKRITQSIVGIVILFLSGLILYTINPTFFTGG